MSVRTSIFGTAAFGALALTVGLSLSPIQAEASTSVIDFTSDATLLNGTVLGSIGWTATGVPTDPNANEAFNGANVPADSFGGLAFDTDGWGIIDDEISVGRESITITFSEEVAILGFAFLDLFADKSVPGTGEFGILTVGSTVINLFFDPAADTFGGYAETLFATPLYATSVTFTAGSTNDRAGVADGALAALQVATVPLPAGGLLLLTALGGLAVARRRKAA